jgi:hypothetical protein
MKAKWHWGPGEWLAAGGVLLNVIPMFLTESLKTITLPRTHDTLDHLLSQIGIAAFLAGVVVAITDIKKRSQEAESELAQIKVLTVGIEEAMNVTLRFGTALSAMVEIMTDVQRQDMGRFVHIRAGEKLLRDHVVDFIPSFVRRLKELQISPATFELREPYFINDLLSNLKDSLPEGSVWFGITHLVDGWLEEKADPGYYGFADGMRRRSAAGKIRIFRIYCLGREALSDEMKIHLGREAEAGIVVRLLENGQEWDDLSLIWSASGAISLGDLVRAKNPVELLRTRNVNPVCGMKFTTRQGRSLDVLNISAPDSDDFQPLEHQFVRAWDKASPL